MTHKKQANPVSPTIDSGGRSIPEKTEPLRGRTKYVAMIDDIGWFEPNNTTTWSLPRKKQ